MRAHSVQECVNPIYLTPLFVGMDHDISTRPVLILKAIHQWFTN